jgi:hypothetical protein
MRIGTWNLENLFRPGGGSGAPSGEEQYEQKLDGLAATIIDLAPELLAVQEVGDPDALADLVGRLDGEWHTALADPAGRGIRVGFISRLALSETIQVADFPAELDGVQVDDGGKRIEQMGRPALRARVTSGSTVIDVVSTHLKSKLVTFPRRPVQPAQ